MCNRMPPHIPGHCPPTEPTACPFCDDPHCKGLSAHQVETIDDIAADRDRLVLQLAAAESRAREAEADCAAMREALSSLWSFVNQHYGDWYLSRSKREQADRVDAALAPHPGAPFLAELEAARELIDGEYFHHSVGCPVSRLGGCECGLSAALAKYDAARGAR